MTYELHQWWQNFNIPVGEPHSEIQWTSKKLRLKPLRRRTEIKINRRQTWEKQDSSRRTQTAKTNYNSSSQKWDNVACMNKTRGMKKQHSKKKKGSQWILAKIFGKKKKKLQNNRQYHLEMVKYLCVCFWKDGGWGVGWGQRIVFYYRTYSPV